MHISWYSKIPGGIFILSGYKQLYYYIKIVVQTSITFYFRLIWIFAMKILLIAPILLANHI